MKLLAWDTSSKTGALAALEWNQSSLRLVSEFTLNVDSTHSEQLLWGIHQTLASARWKLEDVDVFGVGLGPGSFTGLRIGMTTARTLAHTLKKPLVGVSSLSALARPVALHFSQEGLRYPTLVVAVTDACKGELFALWGNADDVKNCRNEIEQVISPPELIQSLKKRLQGEGKKARWVAVGEGRQRYLSEWENLYPAKEITSSVPFQNSVQGRYVALLAWEAYQKGMASEDSLKLLPRYLRASDAELKLKAGLLPSSQLRI